MTKLFQKQDINLRRMMYLCIKDICPGADEVIIVTSSLMKDMNSKTDLYRSNSVRVLCKIIDGQLLAQIERYLKQAIVDKSPVVASAALVSALHLLGNNAEIVKRWINEVQEAAQNKNNMVQFHAVALLHALRASDRLAISKLVSSLTKASVKSPLAQCLLVRYVAQVIQDSQPGPNGEQRPFYDFLESCLRHKAEVVIFEAARAICNLRDVTARELTPAITVLQLFLSSSKPVLRFAAVRTLNKVAMTHPLAVTHCNIDMESLISDQNRSIATLAITTLLKTGNESSVEKLLKQIGSFMSDIADDFKIVVVEAIRSLCLKFPSKQRALMNFLSGVLREEGGFEYKKAIVQSILVLIQEIPDAKETGLGHLCEFIEDCEFTYLSTQVLHLLGKAAASCGASPAAAGAALLGHGSWGGKRWGGELACCWVRKEAGCVGQAGRLSVQQTTVCVCASPAAAALQRNSGAAAAAVWGQWAARKGWVARARGQGGSTGHGSTGQLRALQQNSAAYH